MIAAQFDFAIVGSTPLTRLVAGLLASAHGKTVLLWSKAQTLHRLPLGFDLSVAPLTRPESWALLQATLPESFKLIARLGGRAAWTRVDPVFFAESVEGKEALAHVRHMAQAFGQAAEPVPPSIIGAGRDGLRLRDAVLLHRPSLDAGLDAWLKTLKVRQLVDTEQLDIAEDGSAELVSGADRFAVAQTVLADDAAILQHVPEDWWPQLLVRHGASTILTEPTRTTIAPVMCQVDDGLALVQRQEHGVSAWGADDVDTVAGQLGVLLGPNGAFRQAGQASYQAIATGDGAPAVGKINRFGPDVLAGLGPIGVFLAPAIARWLAGAANANESAWLAARLVDRTATPSVVADIGVRP
jgi:hypothetical protein